MNFVKVKILYRINYLSFEIDEYKII